MLPFNKPIKANKQLKKEQKNISKKSGCNFEEVINKVFKNKKTCGDDDNNLARDIQTVTHVSQTKHAESYQNTSGVHGSDVPGTIILAKFGYKFVCY